MADQEESLVMRRSKRSTAGNRMEAALAEFKAEDIGVDLEEDIDFIVEKDEEDVFEIDFESTDEEGAQEEIDAIAEKIVLEEEKHTKKAGKSQLERITAAAHKRQAATFHPQLHVEEAPKKPSKVKRRVSMGMVVDAATGEVLEGSSQDMAAKRMSRRTSTILNRTATEHRMRDAEKKSAVYKKPKVKVKAPTQAELIARALDMEEGNIIEHRDYLSIEEEKRKKAQVVKKKVEGPLLRWVSRVEEIKVEIPRPPQPPPVPQPPPTMQYGYSYPGAPRPNVPSASTSQNSGLSSTPTYFHPSASSSSHQPYPPTQVTSYPASSSSSQTSSQPKTTFVIQQYQGASVAVPASYSYPPPASTPAHVPPPPPPKPEYRTEKISKNYLIHELAQSENAPRPPWSSTMRAVFGDHVNWEDVRVYVAKGRPLTRPIPTCPITGRPARYLDPRTGVPYADKYAYDTLTNILAHHYVWSENLECYVAYMPLPATPAQSEEKESAAAETPPESASTKTAAVGRKRSRASVA